MRRNREDDKLVIFPVRPGRMALRAVLLTLLLGVTNLVPAQDFTVNLKETDIQELIKFVAEATGTTIVVDPAVKGKVKVVSSKKQSTKSRGSRDGSNVALCSSNILTNTLSRFATSLSISRNGGFGRIRKAGIMSDKLPDDRF